MSVPDVSARGLGELVSLAGQGAVVTGGATGIGYSIARRLSEAGASVLLGDVADAAGPARALSEETGGIVMGTHLDVSDAVSIASTAERAERELGRLDIWVNNAGIYPSTPVLDMTDADWDRVLGVNLRGSFIGAREAARRMVAAGHGGVIINLASTAGFQAAGPGVAHYVSSKHGVIGLTKSLAVELGPHGIRVLGIAPTLIETPGIEAGREAFREAGLGDVIDSFAQRLPLGRVGVPDDVARVALFCASDLAMFMTGSTLLADGGDVAVGPRGSDSGSERQHRPEAPIGARSGSVEPPRTHVFPFASLLLMCWFEVR
jgi:NAD(P)-dependent dehydrogenase (short-subunit alcohol dehydrogenase family)